MDIQDVRRALYDAYSWLASTPGGIDGKSQEAYCEVYYPNYWESEQTGDFLTPSGLMVYSYALGPSRQHLFNRAKIERQANYYTWESPDPFATAVKVISEWVEEERRRIAEDCEE